MTLVAHCPQCRKAVDASQSESWCVGCGAPLGKEITSRLPSVVAQRSAVALELANAQPPLPISRGDRLFRGMVGMGTVFGAVAFALVGTLAATSFFSGIDADDVDFLIIAPFGWATIAFILGMIYAGLLAIVARGRSFHELSVARAAAAGIIPGLVPGLVVLAAGLIQRTSVRDAQEPLMLFPPLSAAIATVTLLIARRAKS
jgi:hypothetical protein